MNETETMMATMPIVPVIEENTELALPTTDSVEAMGAPMQVFVDPPQVNSAVKDGLIGGGIAALAIGAGAAGYHFIVEPILKKRKAKKAAKEEPAKELTKEELQKLFDDKMKQSSALTDELEDIDKKLREMDSNEKVPESSEN